MSQVADSTPSGSMSARGLAAQLAEIGSGIRWESLPAATRATVERNLVHILGAITIGADRRIARQAAAVVTRYEPGAAATVVGHGRSTHAAGAAFANSIAGHADFREDTSVLGHVGTVVIPAALAAAEAAGTDFGRGALGEAVVAGYEVTFKLGRPGILESTARGFRGPAIYPLFGATAAASRMLGLTEQRVANALGIAAQAASGTNQPFLDATEEWILSLGIASRAAVTSALLALEGAEAGDHSLDGETGFFAVFAGQPWPQTALPPVGPRYEIENVRLKKVLACGWSQELIHLLTPHRLTGADVERVDVHYSRIAAEYPGVAYQGPYDTFTRAVLSTPMAVALLLQRGELAPSGYERPADAGLLEIARRVHVHVDPSLRGFDTRVDVRRRSGELLSIASTDGDAPHWLLTTEEVVANLATSYGQVHEDPAFANELARLVKEAVWDGRLEPLLTAIGRGIGPSPR